jgi:hypothetical protein
MAPAVTLLKALLGQLMPLLRPWQAQRGPRSTLSRPRPVDQRNPIRLAHNRNMGDPPDRSMPPICAVMGGG